MFCDWSDLSNRKRFTCLHSLIREGLGEFETLMQTRDEVEGLHNCREFSQPLSCLYQAMQTLEKSLVVYASACTRNQFLFCKKMLSKYGFCERHFTSLILPSRVTALLKTSLPVHQGLTLWTEPGFLPTQLPEAWATEVFLSEDEVHIVNKIRDAQDENNAPAT